MIQSGYNQQGGNLTTTQGQSFGGGMGPVQMPGAPSLPFDPTAALRERLRAEAEQRAFEKQMRERQMAMQEMSFKDSRRMMDQDRARMTNREAPKAPPSAMAQQQSADQYERSLRSASMRPTGLGAQMIPGMASDPNLLPSRLRPQGSSFQGGMGPSAAGLTREPMGATPPSSNRGFDYADPYSQALVQQASFGRR